MKKLQIYITDAQAKAVKALAEAKGISVSEMFRRILDKENSNADTH